MGDAGRGARVCHTSVMKPNDLALLVASPDIADEFFSEICVPIFGAEFRR